MNHINGTGRTSIQNCSTAAVRKHDQIYNKINDKHFKHFSTLLKVLSIFSFQRNA